MPVNPNEAPEGFMAVKERCGCGGCAFEYMGKECLSVACSAHYRKDRSYVIFVPRTDKPATANYPCDDMGTPV